MPPNQIERQHQDELPFSSIAFIPLLNQKNYYTEYLRKDDQFRMVRNTRETVVNNLKRRKLAKSGGGASSATPTAVTADAEDPDDEMDIDDSNRVLVLHPGSESIKMGWSTDIDAVNVLNLIAHKSSTPCEPPLDPKRHQVERKSNIIDMVDSPSFLELKAPIRESFKERMKYYKRRMLPNSTEQCLLFNRKGQSELIDDPLIEFDTIFSDNSPENYLIGEDVLRIGDLKNWNVRSPFTSGSKSGFNDFDESYSTPEELYGDIELILRESFKSKFDIQYKDYCNINLMLVLPNIYSKTYIETMMEILLVRMNFKNVAFIQEALASSFGAGLSSSCIVDIGSRGIHIACVEDGVVVEHSRIELDYGLNDVLRVWGKSLINQQLKWPINLLDIRDFWTLRNSMKECITFDDESVGIKTTNLIVKHRENEREKVKCEKFILKVWDDVMTSPMGLFYPNIFIESNEESVLINGDSKFNQMSLDQLTPVRKIHETPVLASKSGEFEGYVNESSTSALQKLQESNIGFADIGHKETLEILSEIYHDSEPNTAGGGGAKRVRASKFNTNEWLNEKFRDQFKEDSKDSDGLSSSLRRNMTPLDIAIAQSITVAGCEDEERMENFWSNVCVVGGGGCIKGIETMLIDRLHMNRDKLMSNSKLFECVKKMKDWRKGKGNETFELSDDQMAKLEKILSQGVESNIDVMGPSDLNPVTIGWKGGCVYAKLRVIEEMWVSQEDWELLGGRSIRYGGLFVN